MDIHGVSIDPRPQHYYYYYYYYYSTTTTTDYYYISPQLRSWPDLGGAFLSLNWLDPYFSLLHQLYSSPPLSLLSCRSYSSPIAPSCPLLSRLTYHTLFWLSFHRPSSRLPRAVVLIVPNTNSLIELRPPDTVDPSHARDRCCIIM